MFDFEDFVVCVESLLLGSERTQELWQGPKSTIPTTWRTPVCRGRKQPDRDPSGSSRKEVDTSPYILEFIDVIFHHKPDDDSPSIMQLGAFFSCPSSSSSVTAITTHDNHSPRASSVYTLSASISGRDMAEHYAEIGAELDEYSSDEHLQLAKMFVRALRTFRRTPTENCDQVKLFYQEFDMTLSMSFRDATREELPATFAAAALLGVANSPKCATGQEDAAEEDDEKTNALRELVKAARSQDGPIKALAADSPMTEAPRSTPAPKEKRPANRKRTQRAVLQKRPKATKLLPK